MKTKIKKGDKFYCIKDYVMDTGTIAYTKGIYYYSDNDGCISDNEFDSHHRMTDECEFHNYFKLNNQLITESPKHYDNTNGSLYQFAEQHKLNAWEFDIIKRIVRSRKKGQFKEDLEKTKLVIDLYLQEYDDNKRDS